MSVRGNRSGSSLERLLFNLSFPIACLRLLLSTEPKLATTGGYTELGKSGKRSSDPIPVLNRRKLGSRRGSGDGTQGDGR